MRATVNPEHDASRLHQVNSDDLRAALLAGDLSRPRLTWYDETTGERIDLSGKTLVNWVAKAANWLETEMSLEPGDTLRLDTPADHWRTIYWSLAAWTRGVRVTADEDADVCVSFASDAADLIEPAAALAASPLQAMSDAMPGPVGALPCDVPAVEDVAAGSRVLLTDNDAAPALTAALIFRGCSVLVVRGGNGQTRTERSASEAVTVVL
jgi:hypothetical protein